eukprot:scaffold14670_cov108-Isochrysis_galbana.AAC.1
MAIYIAELYTTASWDNPIHDQDNTTDSDKGILNKGTPEILPNLPTCPCRFHGQFTLRVSYLSYSWLFYGEKPSLENEAPAATSASATTRPWIAHP